MLQDLGKPLILLHVPAITEQQNRAAEVEITRLQHGYGFFDLPYHMVRNDYFKAFLRKLYLNPIYRHPRPKTVPMPFLPECQVSSQDALRHLRHARSVLRLSHFAPKDIAALYRAFDIRSIWKLHQAEAAIEMRRESPPILN